MFVQTTKSRRQNKIYVFYLVRAPGTTIPHNVQYLALAGGGARTDRLRPSAARGWSQWKNCSALRWTMGVWQSYAMLGNVLA
jgi:hypothetical protein